MRKKMKKEVPLNKPSEKKLHNNNEEEERRKERKSLNRFSMLFAL
jgi:hypothetical protein